MEMITDPYEKAIEIQNSREYIRTYGYKYGMTHDELIVYMTIIFDREMSNREKDNVLKSPIWLHFYLITGHEKLGNDLKRLKVI